MRKRFNYTNRKKILRSDIHITLTEENGVKKFFGDLSLSEYGLPETAHVLVEVYDPNRIVRFRYGTVSNPAIDESNVIDEFHDTDSFKFRVKVVDEYDHSKLLAIAKAIPAIGLGTNEESGNSILKVGTKSLGNRTWQLEFEASDYPTLFINNEIDAGQQLARSNNFFISVVFPIVVEEILKRILIDDDFSDIRSVETEPEEAWKVDWLLFGASMPGVSPYGDSELSQDQRLQWIEDVVDGFCRNNNVVRKLKVELGETDT